MKYELWQSTSRRVNTYTLLRAGDLQNQALLESGAKVIWKFDADNWEKACRKQHEHLGWEPYKPIDNPGE